ncbi:type 12 methyltransferase [Acidocella sp. MX-AZ02]|nr:type 12 methyltransferase [Acidocella sp. MX-AZ02]
MGKSLQKGSSLLDFGTGWGRIARCFIRDLGLREVFGTDVTEEFVQICQRSFRTNNFIVNNPYPPTPIPDERFDFVVAYSVFSHLSEDAAAAWINEFWRVLVPGGVIAVTTRSRDFFTVCEELKGLQLSGYSMALSELFQDFNQARQDYDSGKFVHSNIPGVGGGGRMNSSFYGESFIPEAYARHKYLPRFELEYFVPGDAYLEQTSLFFRKVT